MTQKINQKIKPIKAYAIVKDGMLSAMEIYEDNKIETFADETLIKVIISPDENLKNEDTK